MHEKELYELVNLVKDDGIREFTELMLKAAPKEFWKFPASSGHHPVDERGVEGNIIHTNRVVKICRKFAESCKLRQIELDIITSSAALHDVCRRGLNGKEPHTVSNHAQLVRELATLNNISCVYEEEIFEVIEAHMGIWGNPPFNPNISVSGLLHLADFISAKAEEIWGKAIFDEPAWIGDDSVPFESLGMTQDMMDTMGILAEDNDYWASVNRFINQVRNRRPESLSFNQHNWLMKIISSLEEETERKAEIHDFPEDLPF